MVDDNVLFLLLLLLRARTEGRVGGPAAAAKLKLVAEKLI